MQAKAENSPKDKPMEAVPDDFEIIDVSKYQPQKIPSLIWRECIALKCLINLESRSTYLPRMPVRNVHHFVHNRDSNYPEDSEIPEFVG